ncbi:B3 domain-containing protein At2g31420-like [Phalaenopsis equestris]|uniref:B3 domain-containing protein At2g31420-like n=1 Tax=Phalaenopsis equestris TaxID=78828 RepID=UPI0009E1BD8C|nr:B3 domain-containing protein At2g31420-like [Phalaenopsis equestris]
MSPHSDLICPFSFSLLSPSTYFEMKPIKTLDLVSKLSSPLPPPKDATTTDETTMDEMPEWVAKLAVDKGATFAWKVMDKQIYASDASDQQNRFMIKKQIAEDQIMPMMTEEEIIAANLIITSNKRRIYGEEKEKGERKQGREHGGLEVMVYNRGGWGCLLYLTRWDASKATVLKGANYKEFFRRSYFVAGNQVEVWAFRNGDGKLCFVIGSKIDLQLSL